MSATFTALPFNDQLDRALGRGQPVVNAGAAALIKTVAAEEKSLRQEAVLGLRPKLNIAPLYWRDSILDEGIRV